MRRSVPQAQPRVTLGWTTSESGAAPTGYRVLRDDAPVAEVGADATTFIDEAVVPGETYRYQVAAVTDQGRVAPDRGGGGDDADASRRGSASRRHLPRQAARTLGTIDRFRVRHREPAAGQARPGSLVVRIELRRRRDRPCRSTWSGLEGEIVPSGSRWTGRVQGLPARCRGSDDAKAPIEVDFEAVDVGLMGSTWSVIGFRGTASVSFRCPGFPRASATVEVSGSHEPV